ncbi:Histidine kinase [Sesamum angolense]|uniref:histidine kinase n=1 Tax=Sesamum angolense TaxID=2727404 RepID=A0AAE1W406_9LAMI|nr:Histidine kinase [Sesamum angolense]
MSSNRKNSGSNGKLCSSYNPQDAKRASDRKWRRGLALLWFVVLSSVFIWVLYSILTAGRLGKKVETPLISEDKAQDSLENCNASMEKQWITSLGLALSMGEGKKEIHDSVRLGRINSTDLILIYCIYGMPQRIRMCNPSRSTILCALKMLGSGSQIIHKLWELVAENVGLAAPCPSIEAISASYHGLPSSQEISSSFFNTTVSSISSAHLCCKEPSAIDQVQKPILPVAFCLLDLLEKRLKIILREQLLKDLSQGGVAYALRVCHSERERIEQQCFYDVPSLLVEKLYISLLANRLLCVNVYDTNQASCTIKMYGTDVADMLIAAYKSTFFGDPTGSMRCIAGSHEIRTPMNGVLGNFLDFRCGNVLQSCVVFICRPVPVMPFYFDLYLFTVDLPYCNFTKAEENLLDKIWQPCNLTVSELKGLRALVIDEKRIRAEVARYHLQRLGISVDLSSSMKSACSYLSSVSESEHIAMVLIDQESWDKETCFLFHSLIKKMRHTISRSVRGFSLKIFLLATCLSSTDRNKLKLDELVDDLITKPLRLSALVSTFQETTGKRLDTRGKPSRLRNLLKGKQILVVDDNVVNRRVAEGALKKYGAVVTCVEGGKFAVELLKPPHEFDACFMDLQMPEMDGFEATRQIRNFEKEYNEKISCGETSVGGVGGTPSRWHTPILAMTADVIQATNEACMKCGMDDYVSKPFGEGQLYSAVARFFETG